MLGMKRSLLGIVLCATLFLALLLVAVADTRVVCNQIIITEPVLSWSLIEAGGRMTVHIMYAGATEEDPVQDRLIAGTVDTDVISDAPFQ